MVGTSWVAWGGVILWTWVLASRICVSAGSRIQPGVSRGNDFETLLSTASRDWGGQSNDNDNLGRHLLQEAIGLIQGGQVASKGRFPYMSSLRSQEDFHTCGGVLIEKNWVLTAAHCLDPDAKVSGEPLGLNPQLTIGGLKVTDGTDVVGVEVFSGEAILHPKWNGDLLNGFDIALIKLKEASTKPPIKLAAKGAVFKNQRRLAVVGWGSEGRPRRDFSKILKWGTVAYRGNEACNVKAVWNGKIIFEMMCAGATVTDTTDVCIGDSGGPLFVPHAPEGSIMKGSPDLDVLVGIVSFGGPMGCSSALPFVERLPVVYTRVSEFRDWIAEVISGKESAATKTLPKQTPVNCEAVDPCTKQNERLLEAAQNGNYEKVKDAVSKGAFLEARNANGFTPLIRAAREGEFGIVKFLISEGADVDAQNNRGTTSLFLASMRGRPNVVRVLVDAGANLDLTTNSGASPLMAAAANGFLNIVETLINAGADQSLKDDSGATAKAQICQDLDPEDCTDGKKARIAALFE